jgi:hypothetical protein
MGLPQEVYAKVPAKDLAASNRVRHCHRLVPWDIQQIRFEGLPAERRTIWWY